MDKQQGLNYTAHETLLNVMWQPEWEGSLRENASCIFMAESPRYSPEAIATLLISYTPIQNKKFKKRDMPTI